MKRVLLSTMAFIAFNSNSQNVNIPDANFKSFLVSDITINTNSDSEIQISEANSYSGMIDCSYEYINDLTGIEEFTSLTSLICSNNTMNVVDVSQCQSLETLKAAFGVVTTVIPPLSGSLITLGSYNNFLDDLDLSYSPLLESVDINNTSLTSLDVTNCSNLITLLFANAPISSIDLSSSSLLETLSCGGTSLSMLDLSLNTEIQELFISGCPNLSDLNISNGNNSIVTYFYATNNPNLTCIQVDNVAYSSINWLDIDASAGFNTDCTTHVTDITVTSQSAQTVISSDGGTLQMLASVLPIDATNSTYSWSVTNGTGMATIDASGLLTASNNGIVTVNAIANDVSGVSGSIDIEISNQTMALIESNVPTLTISMFPNPTSGVVNFHTTHQIEKIDMYNLVGEKVITVFDSSLINISNFPKGVYVLEISTVSGVLITKKLIKV
jgi:hypothetical protein